MQVLHLDQVARNMDSSCEYALVKRSALSLCEVLMSAHLFGLGRSMY